MVFEARILGEGAPLAGAELKVMIFDVDFGEPALSGPDGSVSVSSTEFADPLPASVEVSAPGFASVALETRAEPGVTTHLGIVDLAPGGVVSGVVLDEHGRGLANCTITIAEDGSSKRQLEQMRFMAAHVRVPSTRTDDLGRFRLDGLPVGMVRLWGHADAYLSGYTAPIEVRAGQETFGVEFELEPRGPSNRVRGIVLGPEGKPIAEANLRYRNSSKAARTTTAGDRKADENGRFEFLMSEDATLALTASDPDGRWSPATVANISTGGGELVLRLTEEVLLTLEVRGEDGQLVTRFGLEVFEQDGEHRLKSLPSEERPEGGAEFPRPSTAFIVRITAPGFALLELGPLDPALLEQPDLHAVLAPLPGLRGQVLRDGAPAAGVRVSLRRQIEGSRMLIRNGFRMRMEGNAIDEARTDSEGRFLLTPRASGGYFARAEPHTGAPAEFGPFEVGYDLSGPDLLLQLGEGGAIEGRVELAQGADPEGAIIGITRGDGRARTLRAGADGHFRIENLMAGPWRVELRDEELISGQTSSISSDAGGDRPYDEWSCTVFDGETTYFDLLEVPTGSWPFTGRLTINGEPAQDWTAALVPNGTLISFDGPTANLDRNGEFALQALNSGPQRLLLRSSLGEDAEQFLVDEVLVRDGTWSHDLKVGSLTVTGLPHFDAEDVPAVAHFWQGRGDLWCLTMFASDAAGEAHLTRIPAGPSRLVKPAQNFEPETWTVLRELELEPRGTQTLSLR